jgi:hypothetical protein
MTKARPSRARFQKMIGLPEASIAVNIYNVNLSFFCPAKGGGTVAAILTIQRYALEGDP